MVWPTSESWTIWKTGNSASRTILVSPDPRKGGLTAAFSAGALTLPIGLVHAPGRWEVPGPGLL